MDVIYHLSKTTGDLYRVSCNKLCRSITCSRHINSTHFRREVLFKRRVCPRQYISCKHITIIVKHEVYQGKWRNYTPTLNHIKRILKNYMKMEIFIATMNDTVEKTMGKWSSIYNNLMNVLIYYVNNQYYFWNEQCCKMLIFICYGAIKL